MVAWLVLFRCRPRVFLMTFLLLFIASHAVGQGAVIWVLISEIFPNKVRASGTVIRGQAHIGVCGNHYINYPCFFDKQTGVFSWRQKPWPIFAFSLAFMMVLQLIWVLTKSPGNKEVSLEELEKDWSGNRFD